MSLMAKPTTRFMRTMLITTRKAAKRTLANLGRVEIKASEMLVAPRISKCFGLL